MEEHISSILLKKIQIHNKIRKNFGREYPHTLVFVGKPRSSLFLKPKSKRWLSVANILKKDCQCSIRLSHLDLEVTLGSLADWMTPEVPQSWLSLSTNPKFCRHELCGSWRKSTPVWEQQLRWNPISQEKQPHNYSNRWLMSKQFSLAAQPAPALQPQPALSLCRGPLRSPLPHCKEDELPLRAKIGHGGLDDSVVVTLCSLSQRRDSESIWRPEGTLAINYFNTSFFL